MLDGICSNSGKCLEVFPVPSLCTCVSPGVEDLVPKAVEGQVPLYPVSSAHHKVSDCPALWLRKCRRTVITIQARDGGGRPGIKYIQLQAVSYRDMKVPTDLHLMSPLVPKVPVQVHPPAQPKHLLVRSPVLPPQPVCSVRVFIPGERQEMLNITHTLAHSPIRVHHWQDEEIKLIQQLAVARVCYQVPHYKCHRGRADPLPGMDTCR